jgi:hypothetical protein
MKGKVIRNFSSFFSRHFSCHVFTSLLIRLIPSSTLSITSGICPDLLTAEYAVIYTLFSSLKMAKDSVVFLLAPVNLTTLVAMPEINNRVHIAPSVNNVIVIRDR